ncbi:DUF998 domain-containing protein [Haloarcula sp. Atlit-7R]|uniref:DUF998 domain-containing protein n=1 Tax=Haloarcula sp. Atlit-7R TaxID=2282125 RepID=UPI000EF13BF9|nr:DUF998 domain-containing protein [Haloarcula sp. Atlit-7R]RLM89540.1 DUF998 domain-containing protein [Haloarcula sp. Atlit-7R]
MSRVESASDSESWSFPYPWVTEVGVAGFFLVALLIIALRGDLNPVDNYISEYAVGPHGWGMRIGFVLLGIGSLNLVPGFFRPNLALEGRHQIGYLLAIWTVAVLTAAVFPVDLQGTPVTPIGTVHLVASLVGFLSLFVAMAVSVRRFKQSETWRDRTRLTRAVAVLTPFVFVLEVSLFSTLGWVGIGQWLLFALSGGWLVVLARQFDRLEESIDESRRMTRET